MTTSEKRFEVKVNGTEFVMEDPSPTALEILVFGQTTGSHPETTLRVMFCRAIKASTRANQRVNLAEDNVFHHHPGEPDSSCIGGQFDDA